MRLCMCVLFGEPLRSGDFRKKTRGSTQEKSDFAIALGLCHMTVDLLVWFGGTNELSLNQKSLVFWFLLNLF